METAPGLNRGQRRGVMAGTKRRKMDLSEKFAASHRAFEESVKDNLAEKVIDNFVSELTRLPFWKRVRFGLGIIFRR